MRFLENTTEDIYITAIKRIEPEYAAFAELCFRCNEWIFSKQE